MQLSDNMQIVKQANDDDFFMWVRFVRYGDVPRWEEPLLVKMINDRLIPHGLEFNWGCCGTNQITRRE